jgi:type II secretion system protein N
LYVVTAGLVALAGVAALFASVPTDRFIRPRLDQLATSMGVEVRYRRSQLGLSGIALAGVQVDTAGHGPATTPSRTLEVDHLLLRPSLWGVVTGRRGMPWTMMARLYDGSASATVDGRPEDWTIDLAWLAIDMSGVANLWGQVQLTGRSDGRVLLSGPGAEGKTTEGSWDILARKVTADGLRRGRLEFPPLDVPKLRTVGSWKRRRVVVRAFKATGSFGRISLSGRMMLREPAEKSALSMELTHVAPRQIPPDLAPLLRMLLPMPPAETHGASYRVSGTLGLPSVTVAGPP